MKHLKLFEATSNHYWKISKNEYDNLTEIVNIIDFRYEDKLNKWIESMDGFRKESDNKISFSKYDTFKPFFIGDRYYSKRGLQRRNGVVIYRLEATNPDTIVHIFESDDDWFWVMIEKSTINYYKCDQFDGLKKLLTDKNILYGKNNV